MLDDQFVQKSMYKALHGTSCIEELGESGAGKYGDYRNCDAAKTTLDSLFTHLKSIEDQVYYVHC